MTVSTQKLLHDIALSMGMMTCDDNPYGCGVFMTGNGHMSEGFFWYVPHDDRFVLSRCDFVFKEDCPLSMPPQTRYIALRLDEANHLPPGKIIAFMEERGDFVDANIKRGTRIAYTEVLYFPLFYENRLDLCLSGSRHDPVVLLKNMGGEHNWPVEMMDILVAIRSCELNGAAADLFYTGKAYELMAMPLKMGDVRSPKKSADYDRLLAVIEHIDTHADQTIRQQDLVRKANMSPTKLKTLFKQFTGKSITDYLLDKRIDHAAHLLSETDRGIEEVAHAVGFETATGFATSFKKRMGLSPSSYRKQMSFYCIADPSNKDTFDVAALKHDSRHQAR